MWLMKEEGLLEEEDDLPSDDEVVFRSALITRFECPEWTHWTIGCPHCQE